MQYLYITLSLYVYWLAVCGILLFGAGQGRNAPAARPNASLPRLTVRPKMGYHKAKH